MNCDISVCYYLFDHQVASSDATNIKASIVRDGSEYVINGHKWWSSGETLVHFIE